MWHTDLSLSLLTFLKVELKKYNLYLHLFKAIFYFQSFELQDYLQYFLWGPTEWTDCDENSKVMKHLIVIFSYEFEK